jgi:hypothetical protein
MPSYVESVDLALSSRQLHIISTTASSQDYGGGVCQFTFQQPVIPENDQIITRVALEKVNIPNVAKNITSANYTVEFTQNSTNYRGNLDAGYYNISQLVTAFNTLTTTLNPPGGLTLSYSSITNRCTLTSTTYATTLTTTQSGTSIWGFLFLTTNTASTSITSTQGINVMPTQNYYLSISTLPNQVETSHDLFPAVSVRVPVNVGYLGIVSYQPIEFFWLESRNLSFTNITVSIYDDNGDVVDMDNQTWSATFYVDFAYLNRAEPKPNDNMNTFSSQAAPNFADPLMSRRRDFDRLLKRGRNDIQS